MTPLDQWMGDLAELPGTRAPTPAEQDALRARGNRGDLHLLRLGPALGERGLDGLSETRFVGPSLLLGPDGPCLDAATVQGCVLGDAVVLESRVAHSVLGPRVRVEHHAVVEHSTLLALGPPGQRTDGPLSVHVRSSHLTACLVLGGSDVGPYCHARSHCVVGPFAHVGTGSELKAANLLGATPRNRIELPHRSYFGNASAKALHLRGADGTVPPFGSPAYLAALERGLAFLYGGETVRVATDDEVPGAVQPREHLLLRRDGEELHLDVEGVNLGALTTTSNFDPRGGGAKLPTDVEAGARFGVLAIAQSPVHVAAGVLVASGAKLTGDEVPPDSLVLPGGPGGVLAGYLAQTRARLGDGAAETVTLTLGYLRQLCALARATQSLAAGARGLGRLGPWRASVALAAQLGELHGWLRRYLRLVVRSAPRVTADAEAATEPGRRARLLARAAEQRAVAEAAAGHEAELDALWAQARTVAEALGREATLGRVAAEHGDATPPHAAAPSAACTAAAQAPERAAALATEEEVAVRHLSFARAAARAELPALFGTSGIRGRFAAQVSGPPSIAFTGEGLVSPALAYLAGRALARTLAAEVPSRTAHLARDGRTSGEALCERLGAGLRDEGWAAVSLGVTTTPAAAEAHPLTLVVTASHNPPADNGVKVFLGGVPLPRRLEATVEAELRALESLAAQGRAPAPRRTDAHAASGSASSDAPAAAKHYLRLRETLDALDLAHRFSGHRLSLDLAHGAAACGREGGALNPSAPVALWLGEGVAVVGYGLERDGARINERLGAAYAYGEGRAVVDGALREVAPGVGELAAFAAGAHGHGVGLVVGPDGAPHPAGPAASRTVLWPRALPLPVELAAYAEPMTGGHLAFTDVDGEGREPLRLALDEALAVLPALPALAVDGDADRTLVTEPTLALRPTPFVGGDELLRLCAAHAPGPVRRVVFTVESGLGLEKLFEARGLPYDVVTVGDRAVAECLLARAHDAAPGWLYGGEPSGHLLLCEVTADGSRRLCDDPFAVHLHVLALCRRTGRGLDALLTELEQASLAPPTARKPDAWGLDPARGLEGLSLAEKAALRLWDPEGRLSPYAEALIADYLPQLGEQYARLFHGDQAFAVVTPAPRLATLRRPTAGAAGKEEVPAGELSLFVPTEEAAVEVLEATLQVTGTEHFGPDDVVLRVYSRDGRGAAMKAAELVARNSGTSPKNAAYHKLWPLHGPTGRRVDDASLGAAAEELARRRARFTDAYVAARLRGPTEPTP